MVRFDRGRRSRTAVAPLERLKILQQVRPRAAIDILCGDATRSFYTYD